LLWIGVHEEADATAPGFELLNNGTQRLAVASEIKAVVGSKLIIAVGDQRHLIWLDLLNERHKAGVVSHVSSI